MKKKLILILMLGAILFAPFQKVYSQEREITGTVTNAETGNPVANVTVTVKGTNIKSITDLNGIYHLSIPDTMRTVEFSDFPGMNIKGIDFVSADVINIMLTSDTEIDLWELSLEELMTITVTSASKFEEKVSETPATIFIITKQEIENCGYTSLPEIIQNLPGFDIIVKAGDGYQNNYSRGNRTSIADRTIMMIDGVEANMIWFQFMPIQRNFPLSSIERIEVLYGPASAVYGPNAFNGIINIITKKPGDEVQFTSDVGGGDFNTGFVDASLSGKVKSLGLSLSYRQFYSTDPDFSDKPGFFADEPEDLEAWGGAPISVGNGALIGNPDIWGPYADYYTEYINPVRSYCVLAKLTFNDFIFSYNRLRRESGSGTVYPLDKTLSEPRWIKDEDIYSAKYSKEVTEKIYYNFLTLFSRGDIPGESLWAQGWNSAVSWDSDRTVMLGAWKSQSTRWAVYNDFIYKHSDILTLSGGVRYVNNNYQKTYEFSWASADYGGTSSFDTWYPTCIFTPGDTYYTFPTGPVHKDSVLLGALFPAPISDKERPGNRFTETEYGVYLQLKWSPVEKLFLVGGIRYDDDNLYGDNWNPRVGCTYKLSQDILLKANFGTAFQAPSPRSLYGGWAGTIVSAALQPEEIYTIDGGGLFSIGKFINDVTGYYSKVTNTAMLGKNLPDRKMFGLEYKGKLNIGDLNGQITNMRIRFNYSFVDAKYVEVITDQDILGWVSTGRSSDKVGDIAPHKFNFMFDTDLFKKLHLHLRLNYISERQTIVSNPIEKIDQYFVAHTSIQYRFNEKVSAYLKVNNLFDTEYYHPGIVDAGAGEDTSQPSKTWYSSRIPQFPRYFTLGLEVKL